MRLHDEMGEGVLIKWHGRMTLHDESGEGLYQMLLERRRMTQQDGTA